MLPPVLAHLSSDGAFVTCKPVETLKIEEISSNQPDYEQLHEENAMS